MKIAAAQIKPIDGNIESNMAMHVHWIDEAVLQNVRLIVFPEMSLTGYQRERAEELSLTEFDLRLDVLQKNANENNICIVAGAPIKIDSKIFIGSFILQPNKQIEIYNKQYLHNGEEIYFESSFNFNPLVQIENENISLAICADISNEKHVEVAFQNNTSLYLASIFYTPNGIDEAYFKLANYAGKFNMNILMANYVGESYQMNAAGRSAYWNNKGELIKSLNETEERILITEI